MGARKGDVIALENLNATRCRLPDPTTNASSAADKFDATRNPQDAESMTTGPLLRRRMTVVKHYFDVVAGEDTMSEPRPRTL